MNPPEVTYFSPCTCYYHSSRANIYYAHILHSHWEFQPNKIHNTSTNTYSQNAHICNVSDNIREIKPKSDTNPCFMHANVDQS